MVLRSLFHKLLYQEDACPDKAIFNTYTPLSNSSSYSSRISAFSIFNPYPTAFPYGNGMVLHFYQQQESSTTKTVHKVIKKGLKTYV